MKDGVTIAALELENVKRVRAVALRPDSTGLTVIGGGNAQGKTSVLDAIVWALGGDRYKPSNPVHEGADEAYIRLELSNGLIVERKGVNGTLKVSGGGGGGQAVLNSFVSELALNLPKFMAATPADKAKMLLDCFPGLGKKLQDLNEQIKALYDDRLAVGRIADMKAKHAKDLPFHADAPEVPLTGAEMGARMEEALRTNARNRELRAQAAGSESKVQDAKRRLQEAVARVNEARVRLVQAEEAEIRCQQEEEAAIASRDASVATAATLQDADTKAVQAELERIDEINAKVRTNATKAAAEDDAANLRKECDAKSVALEAARAERLKLLATVDMPLAGLSVAESGDLLYGGQKWDCMSGAEQLQVASAICSTIKPECRFVLLDRLEAMDQNTLLQFSAWLQERGLQAIGTRVSTGDECSIIIEDGVALDRPDKPAAKALSF